MLSLTGHMTERCPTAGCWFYLNDGTGDLRVDAQEGGFSVLGLPLGARLTVFGHIVQEPSEDPQLAAAGGGSCTASAPPPRAWFVSRGRLRLCSPSPPT